MTTVTPTHVNKTQVATSLPQGDFDVYGELNAHFSVLARKSDTQLAEIQAQYAKVLQAKQTDQLRMEAAVESVQKMLQLNEEKQRVISDLKKTNEEKQQTLTKASKTTQAGMVVLGIAAPIALPLGATVAGVLGTEIGRASCRERV